MQLIPTIHTYAQDTDCQAVWARIDEILGKFDGIAYYKHPSVRTPTGAIPDLCCLVRDLGVIAIVVVGAAATSIRVTGDCWVIDGEQRRNPLIDLRSLQLALEYRFNSDYRLDGKVPVYPLLACPSLSKAQYSAITTNLPQYSIWQDRRSDTIPKDRNKPLTDTEWRLAQSIFQAIYPLNRQSPPGAKTSPTIGDAVKELDRQIALLDDQQTKVALQIPPGPQRIRGLAGTGKTVLLAMKAANIHSHYPDARVLFTFNTQSLYNQAQGLITRFYRYHQEAAPDWTMLHVRHAWGGQAKPGVYADICARQGIPRLIYPAARQQDPQIPFRACCKQLLKAGVTTEYDYILVDEAQDFPPEFFQVLYDLAKDPKRIYFAFDELQSLNAAEIPGPTELFGLNSHGQPRVSLDGQYPGPMDKDLVLFKSYRCPSDLLMLAHAIGLGIHNPRGCIQMISSLSTWRAIGYELESGQLMTGKDVVIYRPPENSPNQIKEIYVGDEPLMKCNVFATRDAEIDAVADEIAQLISTQRIRPEQIIVISLDSLPAKRYMARIQQRLQNANIGSVIPGLIDDSDQFAEPNRVTLSTVYRAKGNEAPVVFVVSCDSLREYVREVEMRNRLFTCISRSKAFVRLSGVGRNMVEVKAEIDRIMADVPRFKFIFPDMSKIERNLDAGEATRRRTEVKTAKSAVQQLTHIDDAALSDLDPRQVDDLVKKLQKLREQQGGHQ